MSAILSWKLSISENIVLYNCALKHPKTIHLSTPLCKGHNCSTVQHNFIYDGHVNPSFSQSATQPAIQSASRSAVQPYPEQHEPMPDAAKATNPEQHEPMPDAAKAKSSKIILRTADSSEIQ